MSIYILEGIPGSGKSYSCVKDFILPAVKVGREIYTNIDGIDVELICKYLKVDYDDYRDKFHYLDESAEDTYYKKDIIDTNHNALIVVDEAHKFYGSRDFSKFTNELQHFYAFHRHYGIDIVLISQTVDSIDKWIRCRTEKIVRYRKMSLLGISSKFVSTIVDPFTLENLDRKVHTYQSYVFNFYTSYKPTAGLDAFQELKSWFTPMKKLIGIGVFAVFVVIYAGYSFYSSTKDLTHAEKINNSVVSVDVNSDSVDSTPMDVNVVPSVDASSNLSKEYNTGSFLRVRGYKIFNGKINLLLSLVGDDRETFSNADLGLRVKYEGFGRYCFEDFEDQCYSGLGFLYLPNNNILYYYLNAIKESKVLDASNSSDALKASNIVTSPIKSD